MCLIILEFEKKNSFANNFLIYFHCDIFYIYGFILCNFRNHVAIMQLKCFTYTHVTYNNCYPNGCHNWKTGESPGLNSISKPFKLYFFIVHVVLWLFLLFSLATRFSFCILIILFILIIFGYKFRLLCPWQPVIKTICD